MSILNLKSIRFVMGALLLLAVLRASALAQNEPVSAEPLAKIRAGRGTRVKAKTNPLEPSGGSP